jgi:hypothetical protein
MYIEFFVRHFLWTAKHVDELTFVVPHKLFPSACLKHYIYMGYEILMVFQEIELDVRIVFIPESLF